MPRRLPAALVCLAALAFGACSSGGDDAAPSTTSTTGAATEEPTEELTLELVSSVRPSVSLDIPEEPIATAPAEASGTHLDVFALERQGDSSLLLVLGLRNDGDAAYTIQRQFEDSTLKQQHEGTPDYLASGITLFDAENLKRHLVYLDEAGGCLCSVVGTKSVEPGQTAYAAALFPAPPEGVDTVTVQTPVGAIPDVPISDA